jgi:hypothetical protein
MTTHTQVSPLQAWEAINEFEWDVDTRFSDLHDSFNAYHNGEGSFETIVKDFVEVCKDVLNVEFDIDDDSEIDIVDELDDLAEGNYCGLED